MSTLKPFCPFLLGLPLFDDLESHLAAFRTDPFALFVKSPFYLSHGMFAPGTFHPT